MDFITKCRLALAEQRNRCNNPGRHSLRVYQDLLFQTEDTHFGKDHGIRLDMTLKDFQSNVPIRTYEKLRPYVVRAADGEGRVLTRSPIFAFYKTSGTSGLAKYVPATFHVREKYRGPALYSQWGLYFEHLGVKNYHENFVLDLSWERLLSVSDTYGRYPVYGVTQRPASLGGRDWTPPWYDESWIRAPAGEETCAANRRRILAAAQQDIRLIVSVNPSKLISFVEQINADAEWLIHSLHELPGCRARARRLEARRASDLIRARDLWPRLSLIVCWNSASARLYRPWLEELFGDTDLIPFSTTGTEGIVTLPVDTGHPSAGPLAVDQGLYEFVEVADLEHDKDLAHNAETLSYTELETGKTYRLVMTQATGLCRLDVGDAYEVVGWVGKVPRLEFVGRLGFCSSMTGEKLTEQDVHRAVIESLRELPGYHSAGRGRAPMFTCVPVWGEPPGYVLCLEWNGRLLGMDRQVLADHVDRRLQTVNEEYQCKRATERLVPMNILRLRPDAFSRVAKYRIAEGAAPAQVKHHWLQRDDTMLSWLKERRLLLTEGGSR